MQDSPVSSIKQKGNLTGDVRVVRDHVFDIYSLVQQWNSELLDGMTIISEIRNEVIKTRFVYVNLIDVLVVFMTFK